MSRLAGFATAVALAAWSAAAALAPGCSSSSPTPFTEDGGGGPVVDETLTVGFSGTGTGTVSIASDGVAADASGATASCAMECTEQYPSTATVNLTATAAADSIFDGWDPATSDPSCPTVSMAKSLTCTAIFQKMVVVPDEGGVGDDAGVDAPVTDASGDAGEAGDAGVG